MPCFKGLAVSIHTPNGPLPEYSVQRQSRASRIACYIPVPPAKVPDPATGKSEQSTFAISITLLTPGQSVPYSTPKPTPENPHPKAKVVGSFPRATNSIGPYQPLTTSPNETIAAYIYFDGRQKEEVATLLRRGEETWVNSRWVSIPESKGGGLAEREFLFQEVGLERWLNGLDLEGKERDTAAKIERRRQKMERRRKKRELVSRQLREKGDQAGSGETMMMDMDERKTRSGQSVLRYGDDAQSPLENLSDVEYSSESEDDDPIPEAAGQIKVALFRVLASGEVKRGEYSPQFDAQDDDDESQAQGLNGKGGDDRDVDHTTSFAKPKSLDPKTISTQTVTGIDGPDRPYAIFTFMYRGERQLQKMGILDTKSRDGTNKASSTKRISLQTDLASLAALKSSDVTGLVKFRDHNNIDHGPGKSRKKPRRGSESDMDDSDYDDDDNGPSSILHKAEEEGDKDVSPSLLSADDIRRQGELAEGVRQIKLKRQHSAEPITQSGNATSRTSKSNTPASISTPPATTTTATATTTTTTTTATTTSTSTTAAITATTPPHQGIAGGSSSREPPQTQMSSQSSVLESEAEFMGSPMKKHRASVLGADDNVFNIKRLDGSGLATNIQEIMGSGSISGTISGGSGASSDIFASTGTSTATGAGADTSAGLGSSMTPRSNLNIEQKPPQTGHEELEEDL
ncbi:conserved hypothetical protein [Histoplasma capsulatum var. duboisii H88]|uniref:DUF7918 domain-containing protein n=1 Tax=Ajellomyces capsulatus (strain H88) TaxID=544711 RepID=F0U7Y7_AJEC8|nr:conserved hypothetical protein [Histoplasma capsulatum var. duboisii H88]QSS52751.1 hypothetical protein I7I53_08480 [Histoplasma capsulatum var. duboisii H88]